MCLAVAFYICVWVLIHISFVALGFSLCLHQLKPKTFDEHIRFKLTICCQLLLKILSPSGGCITICLHCKQPFAQYDLPLFYLFSQSQAGSVWAISYWIVRIGEKCLEEKRVGDFAFFVFMQDTIHVNIVFFKSAVPRVVHRASCLKHSKTYWWSWIGTVLCTVIFL